MPLRVVFMGTPEFAVPSLEQLAAAGHEMLVVTQPARPAGRGRRPRPSAVAERASELGLPVIERRRLGNAEALAPLVEFAPDLLAVVAFGLILRRRVLELPRLMPINLHPSRLPTLRGVAPIPWTIWQGERRTAVATIRMDRGVDTGDILRMEEVEVGERETAGELGQRLAMVGAAALARTVTEVAAGRLQPVSQAAVGATYAPRLEKGHGHLEWSCPAPELDRLIRAMTPWPGGRARFGDSEVTILRAVPVVAPVGETAGEPGTVVEIDSVGIEVATGTGLLRLEELKPAGKGAMSGAAFARGRRLKVGDRFAGLPVPADLEWPRPIAEDG